jgi:glutamate N-acetyltransferase/amino-acid N-acetyltransferase
MAVGSGDLPVLHPVAGFQLGTSSAGIKTPGRQDLVVMALSEKATVAGVFTQNAFCAAPVQVAKQHLQQGSDIRYLLVNTGNANAGTGALGLENARLSCQSLADLQGLKAEQVLPFSTGVIGEHLPLAKIVAALPSALADLSEAGWEKAASGIMTTDTRPKAASRQLSIGGKSVTVTGIAKGAGMIKPNMATMLGYIACDAAVPAALLQNIASQAANQSFNRITIDGDTSTNDACMLVATAEGELAVDDLASPDGQALQDAITSVFIELAQGLVRDGEGANKFVTVEVNGGASEQECLKAGFTIAESPLVKTALFASDPNWGRLLAAIGRAGIEALDVSKIAVYIGDVLIAEGGCRAPSYTEEQGSAVMAEEEITIRIELGRGAESARIWTSDLSDEYVRINAEYRT